MLFRSLASTVDNRPDDVFRTTLAQGARGDIVKQLQIALKVAGLLDADSISGYFGPKTRAAVMAFQKRQGLEQIGIVGPKTRAALNSGISSGVLTQSASLYSDAEKQAILDAQKRQQAYILEQREKAINGN